MLTEIKINKITIKNPCRLSSEFACLVRWLCSHVSVKTEMQQFSVSSWVICHTQSAHFQKTSTRSWQLEVSFDMWKVLWVIWVNKAFKQCHQSIVFVLAVLMQILYFAGCFTCACHGTLKISCGASLQYLFIWPLEQIYKLWRSFILSVLSSVKGFLQQNPTVCPFPTCVQHVCVQVCVCRFRVSKAVIETV